ncbi:MAG: citrate transporter [Crenarchaeota archaeon]|nr:citrate transporter [Thermoproteota archaeon]
MAGGAAVLASLALLVVSSAVIGEGRRVGRFTVHRWHAALALGFALVALGVVPPGRVLEYVDLDVLGLVYLMSIVTGYLEVSGIPWLVARRVAGLGGRRAFYGTVMVSGGLSIFLENVSVIYLLAPIALSVAVRTGLDPRALVVSMALAADMTGSATMVGDPPAIMTAGYLNLNFLDFIVYRGRPSMFFYTVAAMAAAAAVVTLLYAGRRPSCRPSTAAASAGAEASWDSVDRVFIAEVLALVAVKIVLLSIRDVVHIPLTAAALAAVAGITVLRILHRDMGSVRRAFSMHDIETPLFLAGTFIISGGFVETGLAASIADALYRLSGGSFHAASLMLILFSVAASAVIYNIPYVAAMLPVTVDLASRLGVDPVLMAWSLLIGATLGGTLTYIGAIGNYAAVRYLAQRGCPVTFTGFMRISVPFTLTSVAVGTLLFIASWW